MEKQKTTIRYAWWRDRKMVGTILLIGAILLQIFAFLRVPILSTLHGYTIGMLMGFYNPLFYAYFIFLALQMIFGKIIKMPSWIKLTEWNYLFLVLSIVFMGVSLGDYQSKTNWTQMGSKPWESFDHWWSGFTSTSAWAPRNTNGGILGAFTYSLFAMVISGIGAFVASFVFLFASISLLITGSVWGFYQSFIYRRKVNLKEKEIDVNSGDNIDNVIVDVPSQLSPTLTSTQESLIELENNHETEMFPFDDPFLKK